jgi:lipoprotein-anchoring transpeptidase ErfK/SrfK
MIARQPYLPRWMAGGESNPLGARAIDLGSTTYRIHGTNMPSTIGHKVSSGCIRMLNADVIDLYSRVDIGTKIVVLPNRGNEVAAMAASVVPAPFATPRTYDPRRSNIY